MAARGQIVYAVASWFLISPPLVRRDLSGDDAIKKLLNVTMPFGTLVPKWYPNFLLSYKTIRTDVREYSSYNREMMKEFIYRRII